MFDPYSRCYPPSCYSSLSAWSLSFNDEAGKGEKMSEFLTSSTTQGEKNTHAKVFAPSFSIFCLGVF